MIINKKKLPMNIVIFIIVLYSIMPWVSRVISLYLTTYFYLVILTFAAVYIAFVNGKASLYRNIYLLIPFLVWRVLILFSTTTGVVLWLYQSLIELIPVMLGQYILNYRKKENKFYVFVIIAAFSLTIITTISGLMIYPEASRWLATADSAQESKLIIYNMLNIGGYNFIYSVVLLYPILILAFKRKRIGLIPTVVSALVMLVLIIASGYTTALLLFGVSSFLLLFDKNINGKQILIFLIAIGIIAIVANHYLSEIFSWLARNVDNSNISYRLQLLADGKDALLNSEDNRLQLYGDSLRIFLQNPFFGLLLGQGGEIGGHSFILDYLANYGLFGMVFLIYMYRTIYLLFFKPYQEYMGYGFVVWSFIQTIAFSCVNTGMWLYVLTLYIPCCVEQIFKEEGLVKKNDKNSMDSKFRIRSSWRKIVWKTK